MSNMRDLERAWDWREKRSVLDRLEAVRVFHGPGEGTGALSKIAVDRFGPHYWITQWGKESAAKATLNRIAEFLASKEARSVVTLVRPERELPEEAQALFGEVPEEQFLVTEEGMRAWIRFKGVRHPGLFLDHLPLRRWLRERARGWRVLNTFAYTGSLSVAAGLGGASHVTTLDLSKATVAWAEENWKLNGLEADRARFIGGDVFEWLPRLKREGVRMDCVILDPPSYSRGKKGDFSTARDLKKLHAMAFDLLEDDGVLATSINSANVSWSKFEAEVLAAAREKGRKLEILGRVDLPDTFPTRLGEDEERYLKGWVLRVRS